MLNTMLCAKVLRPSNIKIRASSVFRISRFRQWKIKNSKIWKNKWVILVTVRGACACCFSAAAIENRWTTYFLFFCKTNSLHNYSFGWKTALDRACSLLCFHCKTGATRRPFFVHCKMSLKFQWTNQRILCQQIQFLLQLSNICNYLVLVFKLHILSKF